MELYYQKYPVQSMYLTELQYNREMQRLKAYYPLDVQKMQGYVEEECDKLEYEGSFMFDEMPDYLMIRKICSRIYKNMADWGKSNWTKEQALAMIEVLMCNEMYQRRCRYQRCRCWWK